MTRKEYIMSAEEYKLLLAYIRDCKLKIERLKKLHRYGKANDVINLLSDNLVGIEGITKIDK